MTEESVDYAIEIENIARAVIRLQSILPRKIVLCGVLGKIREIFEEDGKALFSYTSQKLPIEDLTLAKYHLNEEAIFDVKSRTIGSASARYFKTDKKRVSKEKALEAQLENSAPSFDKDLQLLLKLDSEELRKFDIKLNKACFESDLNLSATPDGLCSIDGAICPVELLTSSVSIEMVKIAISKNHRSKLSKIKRIDKKISAVKSLATLEIKKRKELAKQKKDPDWKGTTKPVGKDLSKMCRARSTISNLSAETYDDKIERLKDKRETAQNLRRYTEQIEFREDQSMKLFLRQKNDQVQTQMYCLNAPYCLAIHWDGDIITYGVVKFNPAFGWGLLFKNAALVSSS